MRDPKRTRERILAAALREFAARGFAGARVDRIARQAAVNKRMLYHYFGDKEALFREILRLKLAEKSALAEAAPASPEERLPFWFERVSEDVDWVRLMEWEALRTGAGRVIGEEDRRRAVARNVALLTEHQAAGQLARDLDPAHVLLAMISLTTFPLAFPQLTRLVTGSAPTEPAFRKRRIEFLRRFAAVAFRPPVPATGTNGAAATDGGR